MRYWTPETVERLKELHALKLSASGIAAEMPRDRLGKPPTRNAIIGKLQRLGLFYEGSEKARYRPRTTAGPKVDIQEQKRKTEIVKKAIWAGAKKPPKPSLPQEPPQSLLAPANAPRGPEAILGLRHGACCFPIGDPRADDFRYCCAPSGDKQYCEHHMQIAYVPSKPRGKKASGWRMPRRSISQHKMSAVFDRNALAKTAPLFDSQGGHSRRDRGYVYDGV